MDAATPRQELAEKIRERRHELGLPQDLRPHGGPSDETVRQWERGGVTGSPRAKTLLGIDQALQWQPGTSGRILHGPEGCIAPTITTLAVTWKSVPEALLDELSEVLDDLALRSHLDPGGDHRDLISTAHSLITSATRAAGH